MKFMTKKLRYMKKDELLQVFEDFDIQLPEPDEDGNEPTNDELRDELQTRYDITDEKIKAWKEKKDAPAEEATHAIPLEDDEGNQVICMDRDNRSFGINRYVFTPQQRYLVVDADTAKELLTQYTGFHKASREEIKRIFGQ